MTSIRLLLSAFFLASHASGCSGETDNECANCGSNGERLNDAAVDAPSEDPPPVRRPRDGAPEASSEPRTDGGVSRPGNPCGFAGDGAAVRDC
jgi:hypothetical protein